MALWGYFAFRARYRRLRSVLVIGLVPMGGRPVLGFVALGSFVAVTFVAWVSLRFVALAVTGFFVTGSRCLTAAGFVTLMG
jgi:hypothetical protein